MTLRQENRMTCPWCMSIFLVGILLDILYLKNMRKIIKVSKQPVKITIDRRPTVPGQVRVPFVSVSKFKILIDVLPSEPSIGQYL